MRKLNVKNIPTKKIAITGILLALAMILSLIESFIPPIVPIAPYAKIGFANIILIAVLLLLGYRYCLLVLIIKCVFVGLFSGNMFSLAYSLPAGIIAYTASALLFKLPKLSISGVSIISSILHNFTQVTVASIIVGKTVWLISPYMLLLGVISGLGVGLISFLLLRALPTRFYALLDEIPQKNDDITV